ncbi:MAG: hypothetical protein LW707_07670 [Sphingobacteriales bacterium]|jgi:hypothetical protein|nr:hypothetical protein [Sphingobacteriales bacterium]
MRIWRIFKVILFSVIWLNTAAQNVVPTLKADTNRVTLGEAFTLELKAAHPAGLNVQWPGWLDSISGIEVLDPGVQDTLATDDPDLILRAQRVRVISFDSGRFDIPPVFFLFNTPSGKLDSVATDRLSITVQSLAVDTTQAIRDIKPLIELPPDYTLLFYIIGTLFVLALLAWLLWRRYKNRPVKHVQEIKSVIPAHVLAIAALEALESEGLWQSGQVKSYHSRLTDILRKYLEDRWQLTAMESTTDELLQQSSTLGWDLKLREGFERIIRLADLVKFAKYMPVADENRWSMQEAIQFVKSTAVYSTPPEVSPRIEIKNGDEPVA